MDTDTKILVGAALVVATAIGVKTYFNVRAKNKAKQVAELAASDKIEPEVKTALPNMEFWDVQTLYDAYQYIKAGQESAIPAALLAQVRAVLTKYNLGDL